MDATVNSGDPTVPQHGKKARSSREDAKGRQGKKRKLQMRELRVTQSRKKVTYRRSRCGTAASSGGPLKYPRSVASSGGPGRQPLPSHPDPQYNHSGACASGEDSQPGEETVIQAPQESSTEASVLFLPKKRPRVDDGASPSGPVCFNPADLVRLKEGRSTESH